MNEETDRTYYSRQAEKMISKSYDDPHKPEQAERYLKRAEIYATLALAAATEKKEPPTP